MRQLVLFTTVIFHYDKYSRFLQNNKTYYNIFIKHNDTNTTLNVII